ncbi:hypothetical protein ACFX2I_006021 [Malus domestica]
MVKHIKSALLACKGDYVVLVKEVSFSPSSLNYNDAFILDTASKVFLFSGCNSSIQEGAKALEVVLVQHIKENKHRETMRGGNCRLASFFFKKARQLLIAKVLQRMESSLVIRKWVNYGSCLVVMLPFSRIHHHHLLSGNNQRRPL